MRILTLLMFLLAAPVAATADESAPPFNLPQDQGRVDLASLRGKIVYVDFWASWCAPCRKSFPWMNDIQQRYGDKGLAIVAINVDKDRDAVRHFLDDVPAHFTVAYDPKGDTASAYRVKGMPSSYLIDRTGNIRYTHIGFREISKAEIESHIKQLLGGL